MRRADQVTGCIVLLFSLSVMVASWRMPPSATFGPGTGFLPFWCGALLAFLSLLLVLTASRQSAAAGSKSLFPSGWGLVRLGGVMAALTGYILSLETLGFLLGTALLSGFLLGVVEREKWSTTVLVAILNAAGLYVVFQLLLGVNLPANRFGF